MRLSDRMTIGAVTVMVLLIAGFWFLVHRPKAVPPAVSKPLPTAPESYLGVAESGVLGSYHPVDKFAAAIGRQPNVVLYYSAWGDHFYSGLADEARDHGATVFVQLDPDQTTKMSAIAAGHYDKYLRAYAQQVRTFRYPVMIGFAPEMNGDWDSWGWKHTPAATWVAAWRHVVTIFRAQHATNVTWIWTVNASSNGTGPLQDWWPGNNYVSWVGIDGYYFYSASTFTNSFSPTINAVHGLTNKPILLSETGIGQMAGQARKMPDFFDGVRASGVLGFVWFDNNQDDPPYHQLWRLEGHPAAIAAFRRGLGNYS